MSEPESQFIDPGASKEGMGEPGSVNVVASPLRVMLNWAVRVLLFPFRLILALFITLLWILCRREEEEGPDLSRRGNAYDLMFAGRIAALAPPPTAPPPDYRKQKLRLRSFAIVSILLLLIMGGITGLAIQLQDRATTESSAVPPNGEGPSNPAGIEEQAQREVLMQLALRRKALTPDAAKKVQHVLEEHAKGENEPERRAQLLRMLDILRRVDKDRQGLADR